MAREDCASAHTDPLLEWIIVSRQETLLRRLSMSSLSNMFAAFSEIDPA